MFSIMEHGIEQLTLEFDTKIINFSGKNYRTTTYYYSRHIRFCTAMQLAVECLIKL